MRCTTFQITATIQASNLGARLLSDATALVDAREKELGEGQALDDSFSKLPNEFEDISDENFQDLRQGFHYVPGFWESSAGRNPQFNEN